jgi:hypothetical protein
MSPRFNDDAVAEIVAADARQASPAEMKELYVKRNTFNVGLDEPVYRIVELRYFFEDLNGCYLTYTKIDKSKWGDSSENPMLNRPFPDPVTGLHLTLNGLVEKVYGSCWSSTPFDDPDQWAIFSRRQPSVRIQSTPRKLLTTAMHLGNSDYMHQHVMGRMEYGTDAQIEAYFADQNWQKHLDSLGQGIAASFFRLSESLQSEDEVRLLYDGMNNTWDKTKVKLVDHFAKLPFDWTSVLDAVVVGPFVQDGGEQNVRNTLHKHNVRCPVSSSLTRTHSG